MEQLIHAFGIDVKLIIIQIINFVILAALLSYFLYQPILKLLGEREEKLKKGIQDAEDAAFARAEAMEGKQEILKEAHSAAESVSQKAKQFAEQTAADIVKEAETKASTILAEAEVRRNEMRDKAIKDSESEVAKLAVLAAEKILRAGKSQEA